MASKFVEEEAALSDDNDIDSSEDDGLDDDAAQLAKEGAGFIADEEESEEEEEDQAPRKKKKRHKRALELDDDDLNLVEENTGKKIKRHNKRVFKRQEETTAPVGRDGLAREFGEGGDDYQGLEDFDDDQIDGRNEQWGRDGPEGSFDDEGGEMDDFIEHDGEINDEQHRAHRRALTKTARAQGISVEAAEEFLEIFGQDAETQQKLDLWYNANEIDHGLEGIAEDGADEVGRPAVDPVLVSQYHLRREDDEIRDANMPERLFVEMQNDVIPQFHADEAAAYVYNSLFGPDAQYCIAKDVVEEGILEVEGVKDESVDVMMGKYFEMDDDSLRNFENQDGVVEGVEGFRLLRRPRQQEDRFPDVPPWMGMQAWRSDRVAQDQLRECIKTAIRFLFMDTFEVPVLAMFYKEYLGELLSLRLGCEPNLLPRDKALALEKDDVKYLPGAVVAEGRRMRQWGVLWTVYDKAFQYFELKNQQIEKIQQLEKERDMATIEEESFEAYKAQFQDAATVDELSEWYQYFHMLLPKRDEEEPTEDGPVFQRRPKRASKYQTLVLNGVGSLAEKLVINTDTFARYVDTISKDSRGYVEQPDENTVIPDPENEADIHLSARDEATRAPTAEQVQRCLNSTQFLLIKEIQMHPVIRRKVREVVKRIAVVSTEPTEAGEQMLTPFHKYGTVKRIRGKPVSLPSAIANDGGMLESFDQYLFMVAADKEGLVKLTVEVGDQELEEQLTSRFTEMYTLGVEADMHPSLYTFRTQIIDRVLKEHLVPMALRAVREEMLKASQQYVTETCCDDVWTQATTPPLQLKAIDDEDIATGDNMEVVRGQRVCVVCWGDKDRGKLENSTVMVMLDARGYPSDVLTLPQFSGLIPVSPAHLQSLHEDDRKAEDAASIVAFLEKHWPHLIVVGTTGMACWQLSEDIKKICEDEITQDKRNENLSPLKNFTVRLVEDKLASIYESCTFAKSDLKDYPRLVRRATALGRHCIEPLALLSALMMQKDEPELLALPVHPLQGLVPNAARAHAYEQLLITAISQEGVCVNSCVQKDWLAPMLQFVPGLGPRKAQALLKAIKSLPENDDYMSGPVPSQTIVARDHMLATDPGDPEHPDEDEDDPWRVVRLLRQKVYANAAPYLRVTDPNEVHESNDEIFSMKDTMRVHPRDEDALSKIACAALDIADPQKASEDPIPRAVEAPHKVMQVDIGMYDSDWQERHGGKESRISTFTDLAMELVKPYGSVRPPERIDLSEEEIFWALTGEDKFLLRPGKLVSAKVIWVKKDLAGLVTDNGVNCHLARQDVKSEEPQSLEQVLQKGMEIQARVREIDYQNGGRLRLISKSEELANHVRWEEEYLKSQDPYYYVVSRMEREEINKQKREKMKKQKASQIIHRPINHPRFVNLNSYRVEQSLKHPDWNNVDKLRRIPGADPKGAKEGDYVFYPSRKGTDRITVCIRLFKRDNTVPVFQHIDFMETKSHKVGNNLALGTPLRLQRFGGMHLHGDETQFEDLDEIGVNFVKKYVSMFDEVIKSKKFVHGDRVQVNSVLNSAWVGQRSEYRLSLGFHPETKEPEGQRPVGWGTIAVKTTKGVDPKHYPFQICHKGYFACFKKEDDDEKRRREREGRENHYGSKVDGSLNDMLNRMKRALKAEKVQQEEAYNHKRAQDAAWQQQQQQYPAYQQMPPGGGYYGGTMGGYGGSQAGFVGHARGAY